MFPEICSIGPLTIYTYGLMLVIAFSVSSFLACRQAKKEMMNPDVIFNLMFFVFLSGVLGARIFYVVTNLNYYLKNPLEIIMLQRGGLAWFGGLISGTLFGVVYIKFKKLSVYKTLDLLVPFVALAQSIGRIGCFFNGCCYGKLTQFGIYFPVHDAVLIPTQLISSLALILIYIILRLLQDRPHKAGLIFYAYLFLYTIKRFSVEFLRADSPVILFSFTLFQLLCVVIFFISVFNLIRISKK